MLSIVKNAEDSTVLFQNKVNESLSLVVFNLKWIFMYVIINHQCERLTPLSKLYWGGAMVLDVNTMVLWYTMVEYDYYILY